MAHRREGDRRGLTPQRGVAHLLRGACIGVADLVPGVSGGTVAVLLGVYERLLGAVRGVAAAVGRAGRGDLRGAGRHLRAVEWVLVLPVLAGAVAALAGLAGVVDWLLTNRAEPAAGAFTGLVLAAALAAAREVRPWRPLPLAASAAVAVGSGWLFGLSATPVAEPAGAVWFGAGVLAVCAMILPGISGSFVLLMIGLYAPALDALGSREAGPLLLLGGGAALGALAFASLLRRLLARRRAAVMAAMVGLMLGSLRVLWPWPHGVGILGPAGEAVDGTGLGLPSRGEVLWPVLCGVVALVLATAVSTAAGRRPGRETTDEPGLLETLDG